MCGLHSHTKFLQYALSKLHVVPTPWHFTDFAMFADVPCMQILLDACRDEIVSLFRAKPFVFKNALLNFHGSMEAHRMIVNFIVSSLLAEYPNVPIVDALMYMLRSAFRNLPHHARADNVQDVIKEMRKVVSDFERVCVVYKELHRQSPQAQQLLNIHFLKYNLPWFDMLPKGPACKEIVKFLITEMGVPANKFKVTLHNCIYCPELLPYLESITIDTCDPFTVGDTCSSLFNSPPQDILRSAYLIDIGALPTSLLDAYCQEMAKRHTMSLKNVMAHEILQRIVANQMVLQWRFDVLDSPE